jgi:hypothetical protein
MRARPWVSQRLQQWRRWGRGARRATAALGPACRRLADRLAYRPREVVVVGLLAGGLCGGLAVERWRARHPETAARLEAEPARGAVAVATPPMRPRPRQPPRREPRLDLNRATPGELARLAGISWRLAARIVAARDAFEQTGAGDAAGPVPRGRAARTWRETLPAPPLLVEPEPSPASARDVAPLDESPAAAPQ